MLIERLQVEKTTSHRSVRGWGRVIAVLYETHWKELLQPSWERQMDLQHSQQHILHYWAGTPLQHQQANRLYRRMRVGAAQREISQDEGARFCLRATASSSTKNGRVASALPSSPSAPTSGTSPAIITCGSARCLPHRDGCSIHRSLLGRPRTSEAQALSFTVHYGYWSGTRLVVPSNSSR